MYRPTWKGFLRLSLVSVPVQAYPVMVTAQGEIRLHQLHAECHSRIRYQKTCPIHGDISNDEIVMGYEYAKDQYVEVEQEEREKARTKSDQSIEIDTFVPLEAIDPTYFSGRSYYLLPDGATGEKPYALLYRAMESEDRCAIAQVALSGRDQVVAVLPKDKLLVLCLLNFASQMKERQEFVDQLPDVKPRADELKLAKTLIASTLADDPHLSNYKDTYTDKLREVIAAKVEGHEVIEPPAEEAPHVVNLMDALRKSVAHSKTGRKSVKKAASNGRRAVPARRRRKSS